MRNVFFRTFKFIFYTALLYYSLLVTAQLVCAASLTDLANSTLLPSPYMIYTDGKIIINHPYEKFIQKEMPLNNDYQTNPGCYLACYTHDHAIGIYQAGNNIYVLGLVRVPGQYQSRICKSDNSQAKYSSKTICNDTFAECKNACWAGGDTGGFFGIK